MIIAYLEKAKAPHKYKVTINDKTINFGNSAYQDFTTHGDSSRKKRYIDRHRPNEDWTLRGGVTTAGFWSRWLLWNKPSIDESIEDLQSRFKSLKVIMN